MLTNSETAKKIEETGETISKMSRGTKIHHLQMSELLGEKYPSEKYYNMVQKLRGLLKGKYGIFLDNENRIGYKIMEHGKEIDVQGKICDNATNRYAAAVKDMRHIRIDEIKDEQLKQRTVRIAQDKANVVGLLKLGSDQFPKGINP